MLIKVLIFNGDCGLFYMFWKGVNGNRGTFLVGIDFIKEFSIAIKDLSANGGRRLGEFLRTRNVFKERE